MRIGGGERWCVMLFYNNFAIFCKLFVMKEKSALLDRKMSLATVNAVARLIEIAVLVL